MSHTVTVVVMAVLDPVCEVVQPVIEGRDATLTCRMVYDWRARDRQSSIIPPMLHVSLRWIGMPGTTVRSTANPTTFRGTLETNTTIKITSEIIPSYNCTIQFDFSQPPHASYQYAVNPVSSTCVTKPTTVWSKFITTLY